MSHPFRHLDLFVTESCNLACPYCFARNRTGVRDMPLSAALEAIDWLCSSTSDRVHVTFWGGEPLLRLPALNELSEAFVQRARRAGKRSSLSLPTNGTLLSDEAIDWVVRYGVKTFLSIDGGPDTQAGRPLSSGKSSHALAEQGLQRSMERLGRRGTTVRMTVTPGNASRLVDNVRYFASRGVGRLMVYPAYDMPWSEQEVETFARAEQQLAHTVANWLMRSRDPRRFVRLDAWTSVLRALTGRRRARTADDVTSPCGVGRELIACNTDGTLSPCHRFTFYERSRGLGGTLGTVSGGPASRELGVFEGLTWGRQRGVVPCEQCDLFALCSMGCVAVNYAATGHLTRVPPWACALQRARVEACRTLDVQCQRHPAYQAYLGDRDAEVVRDHADRIGRRAAEVFNSFQQARDQG